MNKGPSIARINFDTDEAAFDRLKQDGINYIQQLSGKMWTDHNSHDPGITILEQLCYCLTELMYDSEYKVADYLVGADGQMAFEALALHTPAQILPCRPTTLADIRRALLDGMAPYSEVDNVWVEPILIADTGQASGLYRVRLQLSTQTTVSNAHHHLDSRIKQQLLNCWFGLRNLGEDIAEVEIVSNTLCTLGCTLDIFDGYDTNLILAQIYLYCSNWLERPGMPEQVTQGPTAGCPVEEVFNGPSLSRSGYPDESDEQQERLSISSLRQHLFLISGVKQVSEIKLTKNGQPLTHKSKREPGLMLQLPQSQPQLSEAMKLSRYDENVPMSYSKVSYHFGQLHIQQNKGGDADETMQQWYAKPQGQYRQLEQYYSLQNQFPAFYGLEGDLKGGFVGGELFGQEATSQDAQGSAAQGDEDTKQARKGTINQLKGYLLLFDQLMANYKANLANIRTLFSLHFNEDESNPRRGRTVQTYRFSELDDSVIKGIGQLYPAQSSLRFAELMADFDDGIERKSRVLDQMLALYGETFDQQFLLRFPGDISPSELGQQMLINKTLYLKSIVQMTADRCGGVNYAASPGAQAEGFGFAQKLNAHLDMVAGFYSQSGGFGNPELLGRELNLCTDAQFLALHYNSPASPDYYLHQVGQHEASGFIPMRPMDSQLSFTDLRQQVTRMPAFNGGQGNFASLPQSLIRQGADIGNYYLVEKADKDAMDLVVTIPLRQGVDGVSWVYLGNYPNQQAAMRDGNNLCNYLQQIHRHTDSLHVVDNVLLRPTPGQHHNNDNSLQSRGEGYADQDDNFYHFRISVLLPGWTTRCCNTAFRRYVQSLVSDLCPAHIEPTLYWLDFDQMTTFEGLFINWQSARAQWPYPMEQDSSLTTRGSGQGAGRGGNMAGLDSRAKALKQWLQAAAPTPASGAV
ncbi:MAG: hypothetical protein ACI8WB_001247 [Phenylobacterium sp.]|jgi:hypothetical protein